MDKKTVVTDANHRFFALRDVFLFDWQLVEEKNVDGKIHLLLQRDPEKKHYLKLVKLEKEYHKFSNIPMWSLFIAMGLAFAFLTLYLVMTFVDREENKLLWTLIALLPGVLCVSGLGLLAILRTRQGLRYASEREERYNTYLAKVEEIKHE